MNLELENKIGGLFMMILFTSMWTIIGEIFLKSSDNFIAGISFGIVIIFLIYNYLKLRKVSKIHPIINKEKDTKSSNRFFIILGAEGLAILIIKNILYHTNNDQFFVASFALIIGVHFFPLGKLFKRKFDYYIGIWTSLISILAIISISFNLFNQAIINSIVCFGCAISTSICGIKMINDGQKIISTNKI